MSKFDDFNARVERTKAKADAEAAVSRGYRPQTDPRGSGLGGTFLRVLGDFLGEFILELLVRIWWFILLAGVGIGTLAFGLGISFTAAIGLVVMVAAGLFAIKAMLLD